MNPFLDSQEQRNTPRGCGIAGACQKLSLLPRKQSKLNQRSRPGRPTRQRTRIRSSRGRNAKWAWKTGFLGTRFAPAFFTTHASHSCIDWHRNRFCAPLQPPETTAAQAPPPRALTAKRPHSLPPRTTAQATSGARVHLPPRSRERSLYIPPRERRVPPAGTARRRPRQPYSTHGRHLKTLGRGPAFC
jgi:hypothetical protein